MMCVLSVCHLDVCEMCRSMHQRNCQGEEPFELEVSDSDEYEIPEEERPIVLIQVRMVKLLGIWPILHDAGVVAGAPGAELLPRSECEVPTAVQHGNMGGMQLHMQKHDQEGVP